jgi:exosome complex RNA-binding protein Rrp4
VFGAQYVASMDDGVIGIVTDRNAEFYRVNIGAAYVVVA